MSLFRTASSWTFFAALAFAPWAYGGTTPESIRALNWILLAGLIFWLLDMLVRRRKPRFQRVLVFLVISLIGVGGWMVLNAKAIYDAEFQAFAPIKQLVPNFPGSADLANSASWMVRATLLLGVIFLVADFSRDRRWLLQLWGVIAIVAGSVALLGLLQKATGARMIFWQENRSGDAAFNTFFSTFYYHANAGAFLNLVLPLTAGLAIRAFTISSRPGLRAMWTSVLVLNIAAIAANTSRMAQIVATLLVVALAFQLGPRILSRLWLAEKKSVLATAGALILVLFALGQAVHLEHPMARWEQFPKQAAGDARWMAARVAFRALPDAGLFGFGPGSFRVVFPSYEKVFPSDASGGWRFLHEDYLQTLLEWGWLGSMLWASLFFGGMVSAVRNLRKQAEIRRGVESDTRGRVRSPEGEWSPRRHLMLPLVVIALAGVAVHALVDFPFQIASIQLYVATYLGICWGSSGWGRESDVRRQKSDVSGRMTDISAKN